MKWIKERDLFIAQTMAFVQSVAGKKPAAEVWDVPHNAVAEAATVDGIAEVKRPVEALQVNRLSPVRLSNFREEIQGRVAAFRAHQELFHRERNEYCNSVLTKLHASADQARKAPDDQPLKP